MTRLRSRCGVYSKAWTGETRDRAWSRGSRVKMPALILVASGHDGVVAPRSGFALSDVALFVMAAVAVWLVRRALRKRFRKD